MKRRPCWCPKPVLWELNSFLMQALSFVPINLHICWPREWKHSIWYTPKLFIGQKNNQNIRAKLCHIRNTKHQLFLGKKKENHGVQWDSAVWSFPSGNFRVWLSADEISSHPKLIMQDVNRIVLHYRRYGTALSSITSRQGRGNSAHPLVHGGLWNFFILRNTGNIYLITQSTFGYWFEVQFC